MENMEVFLGQSRVFMAFQLVNLRTDRQGKNKKNGLALEHHPISSQTIGGEPTTIGLAKIGQQQNVEPESVERCVN